MPIIFDAQGERVLHVGKFLSIRETARRTVMRTSATDNYLADVVSDLPKAFHKFSNEAAKLSKLLARSEAPASPKNYGELRMQPVVEVQAFEEYLIRKEEMFAHRKVESRKAHSRIIPIGLARWATTM